MNEIQMTKHDHLLMGLFSSLQAAAMQQLGRIQNPATGEMKADLAGAASTIDILEMLKVKCRQDTPESLLRFMDGAVMELQMSFVDEKKKQAARPDDKSGESNGKSSGESTDNNSGAEA